MLHEETVEPTTLGLLKELMSLEELQQFRLVGGTALSLKLGHRKSIDLDLFTDQPFDSQAIINSLKQKYPSFSFKDIKGQRLFFATINNIKVDFVHIFEKFNSDYDLVDEIRFASLPEIVALKLNAIAGRGAKKDFWDLHTLLDYYSFEEMISYYHAHYPQHDAMMLVKSITYFNEANSQPDPYCLKNNNWKEIKKEITTKFNQYIKSKKK